MRQIRQALRLHLEAGLSYAQVARAVGIGKGTGVAPRARGLDGDRDRGGRQPRLGRTSDQRGAELAYKYTSFCVKYRAWAAALKRSMRQTHIAGERLFVD